MNLSGPFIRRPIATTLLTLAIALAGAVAFYVLPVAPLPQFDNPTISVGASLPGASPQTMAAAVATPLERQFGRIAGVTEMTSSSKLGSTSITLVFDLTRDIDGAARDVEAAINAARGNLPSDLPSNPSYRKVNPADSPIMIVSLTSDTYSKGAMYDAASTVLAQKLSQVQGVGQVTVGGSSLPAVRVELNPLALNKYGIGLEQVRTALSSANANLPKGHFADAQRTWTIQDNDQLFKAIDYTPLIVAYHDGAPVRVGDIAQVSDSVSDIRNAGFANGKPSVLLLIFRQPGANIITTVGAIKKILPQLGAEIPLGITLTTIVDQTTTISASIHDVERTLVIAVFLVILVVFVFLRDFRTMLIPGVAVPVSLIGTFGVMYLCGFTLDNLSLMALTISTGFVVDDAIVVVENISRYLEQGMKPVEAALKGSAEIGFTVLSISISLIAVFTPILLMGGLIGRLFREFAVTLSVAILISMVISLTTTPMMCALLLRPEREHPHGRLFQVSENIFNRLLGFYEWTLLRVLRHPAITLLILIGLVLMNLWLFYLLPKGLFPEQDTGRLNGNVLADQATSFQALEPRLEEMLRIVKADPGVANLVGFTGGGGGTSTNTARMFISLKPLAERKGVTGTEIIDRLRPKLAKIPGATLFLQLSQDLRFGGHATNAEYQYVLQGDNYDEISAWAPKMLAVLQQNHALTDVNSDQQNQGMQTMLTYDRDTAARFGITSQLLDNTLYDAFGQRPVSVMYTALNQYQVIMEAAPPYWQTPEGLKDIYIRSSLGDEVPLGAVAHYATTVAPLMINHQGQFPCVTLSFNMAEGKSLSDAVTAIDQAKAKIGLPADIIGGFAGTAQLYQQSQGTEVYLVIAALLAVYIVLGILYESFVHPITILTTLPSATVGAALALLVTGTDLTLIAVVGILLLIGIVKKKRHHDDRLRPQRGTPRGQEQPRRHLRGVPAPFPPDPDDHARRHAGRGPARARFRHRRRVAPPARHHHHRRTHREPAADPLYHAGRLPLLGPPRPLAPESRPARRGQHPGRKLRRPRPAAGSPRMKPLRLFLFATLLPVLAGCEVGPDYVLPAAPVPSHYKGQGNWKPAHPRDDAIRGPWWEVYHDRELNALEEKVNIDNQNVLLAEANFREAAAAVKIARAAYYPTLTTNPSLNYSQTQSLGKSSSSSGGGGGSSGSNSGTGSTVVNSGTQTGVTEGTATSGGGGGGRGGGGSNDITGVYNLPVQISYLADVWGAVRRSVENSTATAQASFADLENARLSYQATLAEDYFNLRGLDAEDKLLTDTVKSYETFVTLTQNRYKSGIASAADVAQAQTQLDSTKAQLIDLGVARAQYSDAIATLIGVPASSFSLSYRPLTATPPRVPAGVPSTLLERRPDVASAERNLAAANAEIGVQVAGYYPQITLSGSTGIDSIAIAQVFSGPNFLWSVGPEIAQTIFDAGRTHGLVQEATETYNGTVATYRQTVLTAFQQIEDDLAGLRILEEESGVEDSAVAGAQKSFDVTTNLYKQGVDDYLQVITTQAILLNDQVTQVNLRTRRMTTSVLFVEALGGGWDRSQMASRSDVADVPQAQKMIDRARHEPAPTLRTPSAQLR